MSWDPFKTFSISEEERDLIDRRRKTRDKFREEFRRKASDPRTTNVLDLNFERWHALRNNQVQLMTVTRHRVIKMITKTYMPIAILFALGLYGIEKKAQRIDSGELTYGDRVRSINCVGVTT
ncbi:uncharacterized protein LOC111102659 [Crassostrea virginica]|uniref:NADH dehydrogenase [ubiquinone] 1 beta subcomplex subunit 4 n=1 Tax=Crassostrea virginica TaxID=6565 RepID=A0A8B8AJ40_CRAVI|nr:uncharacterized protein LOC111102659 [Crassostrea virginica]|mmetsp:Transcript_37183/g.60591  ORF Transcript_37183/g.60591 Transcript_37183/m.60591 type:complete len:122 (+) Transcript_37183:27-392(+)